MVTWQKLLQFGWEILIHSSYSPDITLSDYLLFSVLLNLINEKLSSLEDFKREHVQQRRHIL